MHSVVLAAVCLAVSVFVVLMLGGVARAGGDSMSGESAVQGVSTRESFAARRASRRLAGARMPKCGRLFQIDLRRPAVTPVGYVWKPNVPAGRYDMVIRLKVEPSTTKQPVLEYYLQGVPAAGTTCAVRSGRTTSRPVTVSSSSGFRWSS